MPRWSLNAPVSDGPFIARYGISACSVKVIRATLPGNPWARTAIARRNKGLMKGGLNVFCRIVPAGIFIPTLSACVWEGKEAKVGHKDFSCIQ